MYRIQNLHRSQQLLLLTTWLERFTLRICFLNALRLAGNIYAVCTFRAMQNLKFPTENQKSVFRIFSLMIA